METTESILEAKLQFSISFLIEIVVMMHPFVPSGWILIQFLIVQRHPDNMLWK